MDRGLFVGPHSHRALDAEEIGHFLGSRRLAEVLEDFWYRPTPTFGVTVGKSQASALIVTVRRHIEPHSICGGTALPK